MNKEKMMIHLLEVCWWSNGAGDVHRSDYIIGRRACLLLLKHFVFGIRVLVGIACTQIMRWLPIQTASWLLVSFVSKLAWFFVQNQISSLKLHPLLSFFSHKKCLNLYEIIFLAVILLLNGGSEGWIENFRGVKLLAVLLTLDYLSVQICEMTFCSETHARFHYVKTHCSWVWRVSDFQLNFVLIELVG